MSMDLTGITNKNEYYTNHYFSTVFEENAGATISGWNAAAKESEEIHTPWSMLRQNARQFYTIHDRFTRGSLNLQGLNGIRAMADAYLNSLGYPETKPETIVIDDTTSVPVYLELTKSNGAPLLWVLLSASKETDAGILESYVFDADDIDEDAIGTLYKGVLHEMVNEELATKILFGQAEPPRFLLFIGMNQIALVDRNKWNEKRYLQFELEEIFSRLENTTLQAMSVLLHKDSLCPDDGKVLLDELDEQSQKNASGVSQDLKYALRESIELLGNEVLYDMETRLGRDFSVDPVDPGQLTIECLRYMYRMLFVLFIESRPELGYAPIKAQSYYSGYSLESLRDIADSIRDDVDEVGNGYYLHETLAKLYDLIYAGYPKTEDELQNVLEAGSLHDMFLIAPLKAHIFDPEYTKMITAAKLRNSCMLRIIDLMSLTRSTGKKNGRRGRISYANLGINQMGAVYEALLSYRGFIAEQDLYEVKRAGDKFNELDVGYFVPENELDQYEENERVRIDDKDPKSKLRMYQKGTFIYRLAGREREKSASYYTPEVLTKCLVKYALKELLEGKTADEILELTICEPAMGSAAFLNEAINQLAEAYITRKEQETGDIISYDKRFNELQKVKMYIADRNVYGIDLNPVAVELAEVSLWLNTIYEGGYVPWFGTQLINGNSLIGARRQVYSEGQLQATSKGIRWYENAPDRVPLGTERKKRRGNSQIYHFLLGDPGMCSYSDKVIKSLEPDNIKLMKDWNKKFTAPYTDSELESLRQLSLTIDELWNKQIELRQMVERETQDVLSVYGHEDTAEDSHTTIRQKDEIYSKLYKSEHMKNAGPYARLKFAMDYWSSLWFWPIDKAEMLPSRSEFLNDLNLILVGTIATGKRAASIGYDQMSLFDDQDEDLQLIHKINEIQGTDKSEVDLDSLCMLFPRFALVRKIADQNKFMHWELEFADLFAERGGFDLVLGNPPWIKMEWNEQAVLGDVDPLCVIKNYDVKKIGIYRNNTFQRYAESVSLYCSEYENISGAQNYINAIENYSLLKGQQTNLYKCFLPQSLLIVKEKGIFAYIHPDGIFDDPNGKELREILYPTLRKHFQFINERQLFKEVSHTSIYGLNVYQKQNSNKKNISFEMISNLYDPSTIETSYKDTIGGRIPGIKDQNGNWNIRGHRKRIIPFSPDEMQVIANIFDDGNKYSTILPSIYSVDLLDALSKIEKNERRIAEYADGIFASEMFNETNAQKDGTIERYTHDVLDMRDMVYSGPHISVANPLFKTPREVCKKPSDFDRVYLENISENYIQRSNYKISCTESEYFERVAKTNWGERHTIYYRIAMRKMLGLNQERTLMAAIIPPKTSHIHGILSLSFVDPELMVYVAGLLSSLPYDFLVRSKGKSNIYGDTILKMPLGDTTLKGQLICRTMRLNCLTNYYSALWENVYSEKFKNDRWLRSDHRLKDDYRYLEKEWNNKFAFYSDYERREALLEIDVIVAYMLGLTLSQLREIYHLTFPVMNQYENNTWYDAEGKIVFTTNKSLIGVGLSRAQWEKSNRNKNIVDSDKDIIYVAPFDNPIREDDYEEVWNSIIAKKGINHENCTES